MTLQTRRENLVRLIHENAPATAAHQGDKFQRINQEYYAFQSVLHQVIEDFNSSFETANQQSKWIFKNFYNTYLFTSDATQSATAI